MSETRNCVVRVYDAQGVEHRVKLRAKSVYEAALVGLERLRSRQETKAVAKRARAPAAG